MRPGAKKTFEIAGDLDIHTGGKGTRCPSVNGAGTFTRERKE
jgi:hypothetical protein